MNFVNQKIEKEALRHWLPAADNAYFIKNQYRLTGTNRAEAKISEIILLTVIFDCELSLTACDIASATNLLRTPPAEGYLSRDQE